MMGRRGKRTLSSAVAVAVLALLLAGGAWWLAHRPPATERATEVFDPQERALREAVAKAPSDPEPSRSLGRYLLGRVRPYEAMWAFQDALELRPEDAEARRGLARALIVARLPQRALEVLAAAPASPGAVGAAAPESGAEELESRRVAAAAYLTMGDPLGAVTMLEVGGPALQGSPAALLDLGNAYEALGDDDAAGNAYRRLLQLQPNHLEGQLGLSRVATRQKRWGEALPVASRARMLAPGDPRTAYQLALALWERDGPRARGEQAGSAIDGFQQLLRSHPTYGPAQLQLGLWYLRSGRPALAVASLEQAVAAQPGGDETRLRLAEALEAIGRKADAAYQRGRYYENSQQLPQAIREYQRLGLLAPKRKDVPLLLSATYNLMEKSEQAVDAAERGFRQFPDDLSIRTRYGLLLMMTDQRPKAAELCQRWSSELPQWGEPYRLLARVEREALHAAEAAKLAEKAMALDPSNAEYCLEAALAQIALRTPDRLHQAVATLRQGLALDPRSAEMHLRLGEALERLGDLEGARLHYLRSMDHERNVRFGAYSLSQLGPRLKKAARARFYADNVRALREREDRVTALWRQIHQSPSDADAHTRLAELLLQAGDMRQALHQLDQAVRLRPSAKQQRQAEVLRRLQEMREG
jgi:tetratricopeptide (TPR) repeat protein